MLIKIDHSQKYGNDHISILYPGIPLGGHDTGIGSIGRIDHANIQEGTTIKMHPHVNDEILSYFRIGKVVHTDSQGITETIGNDKLMLMKAGRVFYHEEKIIQRLEGLQIFIRPMTADYEPEVIFYDLAEPWIDTWRLIASPRAVSKLTLTSETEIFDLKVKQKDVITLPPTKLQHAVYILYAFQGELLINNEKRVAKSECIITDEANLFFSAKENSEVVVFITDSQQDCFKTGMYSGNKNR